MTYDPLKCWAFAWMGDKPHSYITRITGYTRSDCIKSVEHEPGDTWRRIYRRGGRAVKCVLMEQPK